MFPLARVLHSIDAFQSSLTLNLTLHEVSLELVTICIQDTALGDGRGGGREGGKGSGERGRGGRIVMLGRGKGEGAETGR